MPSPIATVPKVTVRVIPVTTKMITEQLALKVSIISYLKSYIILLCWDITQVTEIGVSYDKMGSATNLILVRLRSSSVNATNNANAVQYL